MSKEKLMRKRRKLFLWVYLEREKSYKTCIEYLVNLIKSTL